MVKNLEPKQDFSRIEKNLHSIFQAWEELDDEQKIRKINFILPFVQLASYLDAIRQTGILPELQQETFADHLESFKKDYKKLFGGKDLSEMKSSDISPELLRKIEEAQQNNQQLSPEDRQALLSYGDKYVHAHNRIMFNYGNFLLEILDAKMNQGLKDKIKTFNENELDDKSQEKKRRKSLRGREDHPEARLLIYLNSLFEIERNSAEIQKDDLENHALLNQLSNYLQHFLLLHRLSDYQETAKILETISSVDNTHLKSTIIRSETSEEVSKDFEKSLEAKGLSIEIGLETEFLLHDIESDDLETAVQRNVALKKILADLNARRNMQTKYGIPPTIPQIKDLTLFFEDIEVDEKEGAKGMVISKKDFLEITQDLDKNLSNSEEYDKEEMLKHVANFTKAEAFFYKFLLLNGDFPERNKIEIDGVYNPSRTREENLKNIWNLIREGKFYEKVLDMIQAHEIAFGPHEISEIVRVKERVLENMRKIAAESELSVDDPNVQINLSLWIQTKEGKKNALVPEIIKEKDQTRIQISQLGVEFLRIIQEVVAEAANEVEGVVRAQKEVDSGLDRKKYIGTQLKGTEYLEVNLSLPAFLNHKLLAAKSFNIRFSVINDEVAVAEIRFIGNNPHFAQFDNSQTENVYKSGLEFIPEVLLPRIASKIQQFVNSKTEKELQELYDKKVPIGKDGKVAGLKSVKIENAQHDNVFDPEKRKNYNPIPSGVVGGSKSAEKFGGDTKLTQQDI